MAVLSCCPDRLSAAGVATAVPPFRALASVQDKVSAHATLNEAGLPQPKGAVIPSAEELAAWDVLPTFVKTPIGTAASGVRYLVSSAEIELMAAELDGMDAFAQGGVLVQAPAVGPLVMAQSVFDRGVLVAAHTNLRIREGARGGASHKRAIDHPEVREHLRALGQMLAWHGAVSTDAILTDHGPLYIDVNPRLVEPGNAWRAGVDLVGAMLDVARRLGPREETPGHPDVATHQLLLAVLGAAAHEGTRQSIARELMSAAGHGGSYRNSVEEPTQIRHDLRTLIPLLAAATATLVKPSSWSVISSGAVANYALTPRGWRQIANRGGST